MYKVYVLNISIITLVSPAIGNTHLPAGIKLLKFFF